MLIGNHGFTHAMSDDDAAITSSKFWELVDELLNSVLFLLIGLELIALVPGVDRRSSWALAAIVITLVGTRYCSGQRMTKLSARPPGWIPKGAGRVLWWGRVARRYLHRAGPVAPRRSRRASLLLAATFAAVLFSVLVQRATLGKLIDSSLKAKHRSGGGAGRGGRTGAATHGSLRFRNAPPL